MNKLELIQALKDANGLSKTEAESVVNIFFNTMSDALANGDRVEIRGLCSIFVKEYGAYTGRNPKNRREGENQTEEVAIFQGGQGIEGKSRSLRSIIWPPSIIHLCSEQ